MDASIRMKHFVNDVIDRAHALALAASICRKNAQELSALAETNPELLADWLDELAQYRDRAGKEADRLSAAFESLRMAWHPRSSEAA
jgi:hypothetical protein